MSVFDPLYPLDPLDPFDFVMDVDTQIASLDLGDTFGFCELLHRAAARVAPLDAVYLCLYSAEGQTLFFPYRCDSGEIKRPESVPLSDDPVSRAIRERQIVLWNEPDEAPHPVSLPFRDQAQASHSAIHLPLHCAAEGAEGAVLGVFGVHSYRSHAYEPPAVRMLRWMAARAAVWLQRSRIEADWQLRLDAADARLANRQLRMVEMADAFVGIVHHITEEARILLGHVPHDARNLRSGLIHLCRACHQAETEASAMPVKTGVSHAGPCPLLVAVPAEGAGLSHGYRKGGASSQDGLDEHHPALQGDVMALLTEREQDVLRLLAAGHRNADVARALFISVDTVKFHLSNIYQKLGVSNRMQAVRAAQAR